MNEQKQNTNNQILLALVLILFSVGSTVFTFVAESPLQEFVHGMLTGVLSMLILVFLYFVSKNYLRKQK